MLLTRENQCPKGVKTIKVNLSEWSDIDPDTGEHGDLHVFVREMSVREKEIFEESLWRGKGQKRELKLSGSQVRLVIKTACDEYGNPVYQEGDEKNLQSFPGAMISRIYDAAMKINGYTKEDEEELLKN